MRISPYANIVPKIYAYTTPEIASHDGWTKIGYTEQDSVRKRIEQQTKTADVRFNIEWQQEARYTDGSGEYFNDHSFHDYLERFAHIERKPTTEWFKIDGPKSQQLLWKFASRSYEAVQAKKKLTYILRKEQQQAVDATYVYYQKCLQTGETKNAEFLWNAKPRFGKTLTSYDFMRKMDAHMVLVVTNRPAIANSWFDDFEKFIAWQTDYRFVSTTDSLKERATLTREQFLQEQLKAEDKNKDLRMVAFLSLQDLKGSVYFGGEFDKLKWVADNNWDLLIIDEAHEGVDTYKTDKAFDKISRKFTLHLSGTPFKAVAKGKFAEEQIFNWTFSDEQEAKDNWQEETLNPYASMPRMNMYTYQMSQIAIDKVNRGIDLSEEDKTEFAFDLNEFFKTNERGQFIHKNEVKKFLDALTQQEKFPFSTPELRKELAHTFWILERVDSAKALAKMLKEHPIFEQYEIVLAAGDGRLGEDENDTGRSKRSFDKVREAIKNHDRTITLSVGQLTTGVTVPEWTAVFMLSNMKSPAEYIQAAFRAQNPYKFEKNGKLYQKENAYIFDFAPERTLMIFDEYANSLYSKTSGGRGTKQEREENIKKLLNFFAVFAEDQDGKMEQVDAGKVLTIPLKIKTEEVIRRGFMSNMLFNNIGVVFNAPKEVVDILNKIEPAKEQSGKKEKLEQEKLQEVPVNENGDVEIPQETIVNQTQAVFGNKVYETIPVEPVKTYPTVGDDTKPEEALAVSLAQKIAETLHSGIYGEEAKEAYGLTQSESRRIEDKVKKQAEEELKRVAEDFTDQKKVFANDLKKKLQEAETEEEKLQVKAEHEEKVQQATQEFNEQMEKRVQEVVVESAQRVVEEQETKKEEKKKRRLEGDIRDRLRGFSRTIPSFIMAYGDARLTLKNFDTYPKEEVFKDVTSITVEEFRMLRDGFEYIDKETGETKEFPGGVFAEDVFDSSVQEFLNKKYELADYFAEQNDEDIFDYIPPQETNQIFTPKKVVQMMVDQLVETDPHIFESPDKTFVDFYMKSGLYITEIVKRLYRNPVLKSLYPDDKERVKHILECQVFGFAPTQIIFDISMSYIFGFDEEAKSISRRNFFMEDTLPFAERGELQELVNEKLGDRL